MAQRAKGSAVEITVTEKTKLLIAGMSLSGKQSLDVLTNYMSMWILKHYL